MSEYEYKGHSTRYWPGHLHPEGEGVLTAEPGEIVDFGDALPPDDGSWYDVSSGEPHLPRAVTDVEGDDEEEQADADQGTGDAEDQED